jgi:hypothetical protein
MWQGASLAQLLSAPPGVQVDVQVDAPPVDPT